MTKLLKKAFDEASRLPQKEQDAFARILLEELASERRWEELFAGSHDLLGQLADEALAEHRAGRNRGARPEEIVISHTTAQFRRAFAELPPEVKHQAHGAYRLCGKP